jgi:hypothetical protein
MKSPISRFTSAVLAVSFFIFVGCSSMEVHTEEAPDVSLSRYRTYAWYPSDSAVPGERKPAVSIQDQTIKASVDQQMRNKGLTPVSDNEAADLLVSYSAATKASDAGATYSNYGWDWGGLAPTPRREGMLSLQFVDRRTNKVVWAGTASEVTERKVESQQQIAKAVKDLFENYPVA